MQSFLRVFVCFFVAALFSLPAYAQDNLSLSPNKSDPDLKIELSTSIQALDSGLLGDSIDTESGSFSLTNTDVSLAGNSSLPVAFSRNYSLDGISYHGGVLGGWNPDVPFITARVVEDGIRPGPDPNNETDGWKNDRCTETLRQWFPMNLRNPDAEQMANDDTWGGARMFIPGQGGKLLLEDAEGPASLWGGTKPAKTTVDHWRVNCLTSLQNGPGEGFEAISPSGVTYRFDRWAPKQAGIMGAFVPHRESCNDILCEVQERTIGYAIHANIYATQVSDVHGNWVKYEYNTAGNLTRIHSNDLREITVQYSGERISSVTANGRDWTYSYDGRGLDKVTQPDGLFWEYDLDPQKPSQRGLSLNGPNVSGTLTVTHPNGVEGNFDYSKVINGKNNATEFIRNWLGTHVDPTTGVVTEIWANDDDFDMRAANASKGITEKRLTIPNPNGATTTSTWTYWYEQDNGHRNHPNGPASLDLKKRIITDPEGRESHMWYNRRHLSPLQGKLIKSETRVGSTVLASVDHQYLESPSVGDSSVRHPHNPSVTSRVLTTQKVAKQDGDTFTSQYTYNTNLFSAGYSFGAPITARSFSNVHTAPRGTDVEYEHNKSRWILNLPKKYEEVGSSGGKREQAAYVYNTLGQKTSETRYGQPWRTFAYNGDGTLNWLEDALGRRTQALNWKRGKPQRIKRPDTISTYQYVDDNGWLTSQVDAMDRTTTYTHDVMGRVTLIDPPGSWDNTSIAYDFSGDGAVQTITKGQSKTTITLDAMLRPVLERTQALDTSWSSYVNTKYDGLGRVIFKSQPSTSPSETKGVDMTYDGLGRILEERETVAPFARTRHSYQNNHRYRVIDPLGDHLLYYSYGYGGPGNKDYRRIFRRSGGSWSQYTYLDQNEWGQLERLQQRGEHDGYNVVASQYFYYDSQQRLCRHYVPEHGASLYEYDEAGQMTAYAKGQGNSGCGSVPNSEDKVTMRYDDLGRLFRTDFSDGATPRIRKTYDANSNVRRVNRGTGSDLVRWTYAYDDLNNLKSEKLDIDGRNYDSYYSYNPSGYLTQKIQPGNRVINYTVDGLGRMKTVKNGTQTLASGTNFHVSGSLHQMQYGNGHYYSQILNDRLLPERVLSYSGTTKAIDQSLGYDARGQITSIIDGAVSGNNRTYSYDGLGYLKTASGPWGAGSYKYDSLGNLREKKLGSRTVTLTYDSARNRLSQSVDTGASGTRTVAYDHRGNVTTLGTLAFVYDKSDQPTAVTGTANGVGAANGTYRYDGNPCILRICRHRNWTNFVHFLWRFYCVNANCTKRVKSIINGQTIYNVYDASGALVQIDKATDGEVTDYVTGPTGTLARITNDMVTYLHPDHLGSAQAGTRANGTVAWREQYTPFGEQLQNPAANDNLGGFTGHIKDSDTGLNYMQARYYDPVIGRFLSVDPVGFLDTQNPSFFNRYRYCSNDPVNCTDPTGQSDLFKKFFDFGASDAAATASRSMESFATSEGMNPNGATDMMNDVLAAGAIGQLEGMANGAANIVDIAGNEIMSSAMDGDNCWGGYRSCDFNGACTNSWKEAGW